MPLPSPSGRPSPERIGRSLRPEPITTIGAEKSRESCGIGPIQSVGKVNAFARPFPVEHDDPLKRFNDCSETICRFVYASKSRGRGNAGIRGYVDPD